MGATRRRDSNGGAAATVPDRRRKKRSRPVPRWLKQSSEIDAIAQRRCLMLLSVLSGEKPVTAVIEEADISRGTYYQLEDRALRAMLAAVMPGASEAGESSAAIPARRIAELEAKVSRLEQDKRRLERLLYVTRRVVRPGPLTTGPGGPGRPRKTTTSSAASGSSASRGSTTTMSPAAPPGAAPSSPTPGGGDGR